MVFYNSVPRGSILQPLLFLIYVNDMAGAIDEKSLLYADDTAVLVSHKHFAVIELKLGTALETISNWLQIISAPWADWIYFIWLKMKTL